MENVHFLTREVMSYFPKGRSKRRTSIFPPFLHFKINCSRKIFLLDLLVVPLSQSYKMDRWLSLLLFLILKDSEYHMVRRKILQKVYARIINVTRMVQPR